MVTHSIECTTCVWFPFFSSLVLQGNTFLPLPRYLSYLLTRCFGCGLLRERERETERQRTRRGNNESGNISRKYSPSKRFVFSFQTILEWFSALSWLQFLWNMQANMYTDEEGKMKDGEEIDAMMCVPKWHTCTCTCWGLLICVMCWLQLSSGISLSYYLRSKHCPFSCLSCVNVKAPSSYCVGPVWKYYGLP